MNIRGFVFLFLFIGLPICLFSQDHRMKFDHLTLEDGLSQTSVTSILKDSRGFMWFGTEDGLNKYDGLKFTIYRHIPGDTTSIIGNVINAIVEDTNAYLWIATADGLSKYDHKSNSFTQFKKETGNSTDPNKNWVGSLYLDGHNLWVGAADGLNRIDPRSNKFTRAIKYESVGNPPEYVTAITKDNTGKLWLGSFTGLHQFDTESENYFHSESISAMPFVNSLATDPYGNIWVGSMSGLFRVNPLKKNTIEKIFPNSSDSELNRANQEASIISLFQDKDDILWVGTSGKGLLQYNLKKENYQTIGYDPKDPDALNAGMIRSMYRDDNNVLWIGAFGGGVNKYDPQQWKFSHFKNNENDRSSLSENTVRALFEDSKKNLWVGTMNGLDKMDQGMRVVNHFSHDPSDLNSLSFNKVKSIFEDSRGNIWIGTWLYGLNKFDPKTGKFKRFEQIVSDTIPIVQVNSIVEDKEGSLWMASNGLLSYDPNTEKFQRFLKEDNTNSLSHNSVTRIFIDSSGLLWIGTQGGLNSYNTKTRKFTQYVHSFDESTRISHNYVTSIAESKPGTIWVGTYGGGLNRLDVATGEFTHYNVSNGLPNDVIYGILTDDNAYLWLSSNKGICRFDHENETFKSYGLADGIQSNEFNAGAYFKNTKGKMFFGGINGFNAFHPDSVVDNPYIPKLAFTDFQIFNKSIQPGKEEVLEFHINETEHLTLSHDQSVFSLEFTALNFTNSSKNQYAYKLEGFDESWQALGNRNFVTFTNLDPGEYKLTVKASNNDGVWDESGKSLQIHILPPWWATWWAYIFYAILLSGALIFLRQQVINRERLKNELAWEHQQWEQLKEIDELKSRFFSNLSHEFRTPLTFILGITEKVLSNTASNPQQKKDFGMIQRSAQRLLSLINQLLDLSRLDAKTLALQADKDDLVAFLRLITSAFNSLAQSRQIQFITNFPYDQLEVYFDKDKLEKIVTNLLTNAFKFTSEKGFVSISLSKHTSKESPDHHFEEGFAKIVIKDNGKGIAPQHQGKIFERFYQVDNSITREHEGTGIGLALCKELIELHRGEIRVNSEIDKGSSFDVVIPLGKGHLKNSEIIGNGRQKPSTAKKDMNLVEALQYNKKADEGLKPVVLVVEDNEEMQALVKQYLSEDYHVSQAFNGKEALRLVESRIPDLIISDVMMPKMDGLTLCKTVKADVKTQHIPIIMLTGRADQSFKEQGLEMGIDDYLTKPFVGKELSLRVKNLLSQRQILKEHFSKTMVLGPEKVDLTSMDEVFLNNIKGSIERHVGDEEYDLNRLASDVGMSKQQINSKLKPLVGMTPNQLILKFRIDRAKELLLANSGSISEVAYQVGFKNASYFTHVFTKKVGVTPKDFKNGKSPYS